MRARSSLSLAMVALASMITVAFADDGPDGFRCEPHGKLVGTACRCNQGYKEARDRENIATCVRRRTDVEVTPLSPLEVTLTTREITVNRRVLFRGAVLRPSSRVVLDAIAKVMKAHPEMTIEVQSHVARWGNPNPLFSLSRDRANAVRAYLGTAGIALNRMLAKGYGFSQPIAPHDTPANRARNDRIAFVFIKAPERPAAGKVLVRTGKIEITEPIQFVLNSPQVRVASYPVLNEIARILKDRPSLRVRIGGHTDSRGSDRANTALSASRAEAVRAYLIGKGIDRGRLEAKGYGESQPIADNRTAAGREQNRRIELAILSPAATSTTAIADRTKAAETVYRVPLHDSPSIGPAIAPVTMVAQVQFPEPFTRKAWPTLQQLRAEYKEDLRIVYKWFIVHPTATPGTLAACAAARQGRLEAMAAAIWDAANWKTKWPEASELRTVAQRLQLDLDEYDLDVAGMCEANRSRDHGVFKRLGSRGVPGFWINGRKIAGAQPIERFRAVIDEELAKAKADRRNGGDPATYYGRIMQGAATKP